MISKLACSKTARIHVRRLILGGFLVVAQSVASQAEIVVFGDSLSDMGNVNSRTFGISPGSGYWQGRYSNGEVWIGLVAKTLGQPLVRSTSSGGLNYAYGGAKTGTGTFAFPFNLPNVGNQVNSYVNNRTPSPTAIIVEWAGGNDYLDGGTNPNTAPANIASDITKLVAKGGKLFLIPNLPLLGNVPRYFEANGVSNAGMNELSAAHNAALKVQIAGLRVTYPSLKFIELDVATALEEIRANPARYGISNIRNQAKNAPSGTNVDTYLFWDDVHPTRVGHQFVAARALASIRWLLDDIPPIKSGK